MSATARQSNTPTPKMGVYVDMTDQEFLMDLWEHLKVDGWDADALAKLHAIASPRAKP